MRYIILFLLFIPSLCLAQFPVVSTISGSRSVVAALDTVETAYPFFANAIDTDSISIEWFDVRADNYVLQSDDNLSFSSPTTEYSGTDSTFAMTGLSPGDKFYFRVKAQKAGFVDSEWVVDSATTFPFTPVAFYEPMGLEYSSNEYGDNATSGTFNYLKSVVNYSGPTLGSVGTLGSLVFVALNYSAYSRYSNNQNHAPSSNYVLGDFEINWHGVFATTINNKNLFGNSVSASVRLRFSSPTSVQFGSSSFVSVTLTNSLVLNQPYWVTLQRNGTNFRVIVTDNEGVTETQNVTCPTTSVTFDRVFPNDAGIATRRLSIMDRALTDAEREAVQKRHARPTHTPEPTTTTNVKGLSLSPFSGYYLTNSDFANNITTTNLRDRFFGLGEYQFALTHKKFDSPLYGDDLLYVFKGDNQVSSPIDLGHPTTSTDVHNTGSICFWNNMVVHFEQDSHYDDGLLNTLVVKMFGKDMNMVGYKRIPLGKGIPSSTGVNLQYHQAYILNNKIYLLAHEYSGGTGGNLARRVVLLISDDEWNSWKKYQLIESNNGDGDFLYHSTAYCEDKMIVTVEHRQQPEVFARAVYIFTIDPATETTVRSIDGTFTKNVATSGPVTVTEAEADLIMGTAYNASASIKHSHILYNPATEIAHCVRGNGTDDGFVLAIIDFNAGTITEKAIPEVIDGHDMDADFSTASQLSDNLPFVYQDGSDLYFISGEDNSGNTKIARSVSTDGGDTWDYVDQISQDNARKHIRIMPTKNWYYTTNRKIFASVDHTTYGDLFVYTIAP